MNARWLKRNLGSLVFVIAFFTVLGLLLWWLGGARTKRRQIEAELQAQQDRLSLLEGRNPFPSTENIQIYRDDQKRLHHFQQTLHAVMTNSFSLPPEVEIRTVIEFTEQMPKRTEALGNLARQAGVRLPESFNFGFERYATTIPCRNPPASGDECVRVLGLLSKQLLVIERLTTLMVSNSVDEIVSIRRTDVEPAAGTEDATLPISRDGRAECVITPFELQFACSAEALQGFVNALTRDPWLFAIRNLKIDVPGGTVDAGTLRAGERRRLSVTTRVDLLEFQKARVKEPAPPRGKPVTH
jgi:hypothetical protein